MNGLKKPKHPLPTSSFTAFFLSAPSCTLSLFRSLLLCCVSHCLLHSGCTDVKFKLNNRFTPKFKSLNRLTYTRSLQRTLHVPHIEAVSVCKIIEEWNFKCVCYYFGNMVICFNPHYQGVPQSSELLTSGGNGVNIFIMAMEINEKYSTLSCCIFRGNNNVPFSNRW